MLNRDDSPDLAPPIDTDSSIADRTTEIDVPRVRRIQNDKIGQEWNIHIPSVE
jgi:hypothetical protein